MRNYREQLQAPVSWWLLGLLCVAIFGTTLWAGFNLFVAIGCYLVLGGGTAATLLIWGAATIEVAGGELRAGRATLPLSQIGDVAELDEAQARALRGPQADPSAFLLIRPYLKLALYVQVGNADPGRPYWLIGTRRPAELAAAIQRSRPQARASRRSMG
jgi:Protein of unknown function (DUF3093)